MGIESTSQAVGRIDPSSLIGTASPVVTPHSTQALVEAYHQGVITADDITSRIGELGKTRKKAELMSLNEATSPEAQAARQSAISANTASNQLVTAKAGAALPGVPAAAKAAEEDVDFHRAITAFGPESIQNFFKYAPLVSGYQGTPTTSDGKPDWVTVAREGANLEQQVNLKSQAALRAAVHKTEVRQEGTTKYSVDVNSVGEDITDPSKKQALNAQATAPLSFKFIKPGTSAAPTAPAPAPAAAAPAPQVDTSIVRAKLANKFGSDAIVNLPDADVLRLDANEKAQPPEVTPSVAPTNVKPTVSLNEFIPGKGLVSDTGDKSLITEAQGITDQFRKQGSYQVWNKSVPAYHAMNNIMAEINKVPVEQQRDGSHNMNVKDIDLISNFIKLYDPEAVIREFKFDKLVSGQPLPERLANWKSTVLRAGHLTPETRQELVSVAQDMYRAKEQAIVPDLQMAARRAQALGIDVGNVLNPKEQELLSKPSAPIQSTPSASVAKPAGPAITLSNGMKVQRGADGQYYPAP